MNKPGKQELESEKFPAILIGCICICGLLLRLWQVGQTGFWTDEIMQVEAAGYGPLNVWKTTPHDKSPLGYFIASFLVGFENIEFWARMPAMIYGALWAGACAIVAWLVIRSRYAVLAVGVLAAFSPVARRFAQEASPYSLMMLANTLFLAAVLYFITYPDARIRKKSLLLMCAGVLALWSGFLQSVSMTIICGFSILAWVLFHRRDDVLPLNKKNALYFFGALMMAGLCALPLYLRLLSFPEIPFYLPWGKIDVFNLGGEYLSIYALGYEFDQFLPYASWMLLAPAVAGLFILARKNPAALIVLPGALLFFPAAFYLMWIQDHWMAVRYTILALPALLVLAGIGLSALTSMFARWKPYGRYIGTLLFIVPLIFYSGLVIYYRLSEPMQRSQWREAADFINQHWQEGDRLAADDELTLWRINYYLKRLNVNEQLFIWDESLSDEENLQHPVWLVCGENRMNGDELPVVKSFYMTSIRTTKENYLYMMQRTGGEVNRLKPGGTERITTDDKRRIITGWLDFENWGEMKVCAVSDEGIVLWQALDSPTTLTLKAMAHAYTPAVDKGLSILLKVNNEPVESKKVFNQSDLYVWDVPSIMAREGFNTFELEPNRTASPSDVDPESSDERKLSFWLEWIEITAAE